MSTTSVAAPAKKKIILKKKSATATSENTKPVEKTLPKGSEKETKKVIPSTSKGLKSTQTTKDEKPKTKKNLDSSVPQPSKEREVKYKYPDTDKDSLTRKKFRHETRTMEASFQKKLAAAKPGSQAQKELKKEYQDFKTERYQKA